jgi:ABC-type branched-subunit amino acid transport system substrate-binding protein
MRACRLLVAGMLVVCAACGSSSKGAGTSATTAKGPVPKSTVLGTGVTPTTIKVGVALVDFTCIQQFVDSIRVGQQEIYQAYIDDINKKGGIAGRQIVPVYHSYCPINPADALALCTKFSEDDKVFAVIANFVDFSGDAQTCLAKRHKTVLITFQLSQQIMDKSPPGLILLPGTNPERVDSVVTELLGRAHTLDGKTVAVLGETSSAKIVSRSVVPDLKKIGVKVVQPAILVIAGSDTTAAQSQLDSVIERWKADHVDAVFVSGTEVSSQQFVEKLRREMPNVTLVTDISDVLGYGKQEQHIGRRPNPYEGIITAIGPTPHEYDQSDNWKYCADIYRAQTGKVAPDAETVLPGPNGKTLDTNGGINDACQILTMFHDIAARVGQYLNTDNWVQTVDNFGPIRNAGGGQYASLHTGKYDMDDTFRLGAFDSTIPPTGNWKSLTDLQNIPGS